EEYFRKALAIFEPVVQDQLTNPEYVGQLCTTYCKLGLLYQGTDRPVEAEAAYQRARQLRATALRDQPAMLGQYSLTEIYRLLGSCYQATGRPAEAAAAYQQALAVRQKPVANEQPDWTYRVQLGDLDNNLESFYQTTDRPAQAE